MNMKKGDLIQTMFDTGAFGATVLYGEVIAAGEKVYRVRWESGLTNRLRQDHPHVKHARNQELAREALEKWNKIASRL